MRSAAGCAGLGLLLLLVAGTFDAEPLYVTGAALLLLGAGAAAWIGLGAWEAEIRRTRVDERVELGASPRAGLMLLRAAKARALVQGRDHALPDDVQALADTVLAHRIMLVPEAAGVDRSTIVADAIAATPAL